MSSPSARTFQGIAALVFILLLSFPSSVCAVDRIVGAIDNASLVRLHGNIHPLARPESDRGPLDPATRLERMLLVFAPTPAQQSDLNTLLAQLQDRKSPLYHHWLTPEQFADRFSVSAADIAKAAGWLQSQGFTISEVARSRTYIAFGGSAAQVEATFHTQLHQFEVNGELHFAIVSEPAIPRALAAAVTNIGSLNNFRPHSQMLKWQPRVTSAFSGDHFLSPGDFANIYDLTDLYNSGTDGTGVTIAVVGQTDLATDAEGNFTDIAAFRSNAGLSAPKLTSKLITTIDPGILGDDIDEANLDVEWSGGIAPGADILFVTSNNGAFDSLLYAITNNVAPIISVSYGICEPQAGNTSALDTAAAQAATQGQTIVVASGDSGAATCDYSSNYPVASATHGLAVSFPASVPSFTAVGGTTLSDTVAVYTDPSWGEYYWLGSSDLTATNPTATSFPGEGAWNDTSATGILLASGGGLSTIYGAPPWQTGLAPITNGMRGLPDLALSASPITIPYLICSQVQTTQACTNGWGDSYFFPDAVGGTSAGAPSFAGILALIDQKTGSAQGNVNPMLYSIAADSSSYAFHDVSSGNNQVPCTSSTTCSPGMEIGYYSLPGYDLATGWGSVDAVALLDAWTSTPDFLVTSSFNAVLNLAPGETLTEFVQFEPLNGFTGNVSLSCSLQGVTHSYCSVSPQVVDVNSYSNLTITTYPASTVGTMSGPMELFVTGGPITHELMVPVTINYPDFFIRPSIIEGVLEVGMTGADPLTVSGPLALGATYSCSVGPTLGGTTCSVSPAMNSMNPELIATIPSGSTALDGLITITGTAGTITHSRPVFVHGIDFTLAASAASVSVTRGSSATDMVTVSPINGFFEQVSLSCVLSAGLQASGACSVSPSTVTASGSATVTITGTKLARLQKPHLVRPGGLGFESGMLFAGILLSGPSRRYARRRLPWLNAMLVLVVLGMLLMMAGCGGGGAGSSFTSTGTTTQNTTTSGIATVTATTSNGLAHSVTISVAIN